MSMSRKIRETRKRLLLTQGELAQKLGVTQGTISKWETGNQDPDFTSIMKLSDLAGFEPVSFSLHPEEQHPYQRYPTGIYVKVVGSIEENVWTESIYWESSDQFEVYVPPQAFDPSIELQAFMIRDQSAMPLLTQNSIVYVCKPDFRKLQLRHNDLVVAFRMNKQGLYEVSLKRVFTMSGEEKWLAPVSDDPKHDFSFRYSVDEDGVATGKHILLRAVTVYGVVVSSYRLEPISERVEEGMPE